MATYGPIKVAIIGAGMSGLAVANGLVNDEAGRFDVQIYERDTICFDLERGGYQLRIAHNGLQALKSVCNEETWVELRKAWAGDEARAPGLVEPEHFKLCMELSAYRAYPSSRPVPRISLRRALLKRLLAQDRVHFDHKVDSFEYVQDGREGVLLHFEGGRTATADIMIAADGSGSKINRQVGLNNKRKLGGWTLIQSRQSIGKAIRDQLPESLHKCGSVLYLGGSKVSGFASVYDPQIEVGDQEKKWNLFWSVLVPQQVGDSILKGAGDDNETIVALLADYFRRDLGYGEELPYIITSATEYLRTGLLTSSVRPKEDWRARVAGAHRVILLGDAVHPMTPGRGMGANTALTDAGNLVKRMKSAKFANGKVNDEELSALVKEFDSEMYSRAFEMVKKSEQVTSLDLTRSSGRMILRIAGVLMTIAGWCFAIGEAIGLKRKPDLDYMSLEP